MSLFSPLSMARRALILLTFARARLVSTMTAHALNASAAALPADATSMITLFSASLGSGGSLTAPESAPEQESSPSYDDIWRTVYSTNRHSWDGQRKRQASIGQFFQSAEFFEWFILALALPIFVLLHYLFARLPSAVALIAWILVAGVYGVIVRCRLGSAAGQQWMTGYTLELLFSVENVFVFHMITTAFRAPKRWVRRALLVVVCFQVVFEMVCYMGLADSVRRVGVLPYVLGLWLIYIGVLAAFEDSSQAVPVQDLLGYRYAKSLLGADRISDKYAEDGSFILVDSSRNDRRVVTLLTLLTACLLFVDFFLEVDVTLTKIEELSNEYISFTSSVVAGFAMPELFFVACDLFHRFYLLKFGIGFVLVFVGVQMLCRTYFPIPAFVGCAIMAGVLALCVALSSLLGFEASRSQDLDQSVDALGGHTGEQPQDYGSSGKVFRG